MEMNVSEELLVITMEECAEVTQECSKLIRFGHDDFNTENLEKEIGDLKAMFDLMDDRGWINWDNVILQSRKKKEKLKIWSNLCK